MRAWISSPAFQKKKQNKKPNKTKNHQNKQTNNQTKKKQTKKTKKKTHHPNYHRITPIQLCIQLAEVFICHQLRVLMLPVVFRVGLSVGKAGPCCLTERHRFLCLKFAPWCLWSSADCLKPRNLNYFAANGNIERLIYMLYFGLGERKAVCLERVVAALCPNLLAILPLFVNV